MDNNENKNIYSKIDNDRLILLCKDTTTQLLTIAKPLGQIMIKYSKLRNDLSIITTELNGRIKNKQLSIEKYDQQTKEILSTIEFGISEFEKIFSVTR